MAKVENPTLSRQGNRFPHIIETLVSLLLQNSVSGRGGEGRREYVRRLCDAAASRFGYGRASPVLEMLPEADDGQYNATADLLSAGAAVGDIQMVQHLLRSGHDPQLCSGIFWYPAIHAARLGHTQMLAVLLESPMRDQPRRGIGGPVEAALVAACRAGQSQTLEYVLTRPSHIFSLETSLKYAFETLAENGHIDLLPSLAARAPSSIPSDMMYRAVQAACRTGHISTVRYLLESGADISMYDSEGGPLVEACLHGHLEIVRLLLDQQRVDWEKSRANPVYAAVRNGHTKVLDLLRERGFSLNTSAQNRRVLVRAAENGETPTVRYLLNSGIDAADCNMDAALTEAAESGHEDIVELLAGLGASLDGAKGAKDPPLLCAMINGHDKVAKALLRLGASIIDPLESEYAEDFKDGTYPLRRTL